MARMWQLLVCAALLVASAVAANEISVDAGQGGSFSIDQFFQTVTIHSAGFYQIWALDGDNPGRIQSISVAGPVTGTVFVSITHSVGQQELAGAQDVWEVDLSGATDGQLGMILAGNYGDAVYGGTLHADVADLDIGGSVLKPIEIDSVGHLAVTHDVLSPVTQSGAIPNPAVRRAASFGMSPVVVRGFCGGVRDDGRPGGIGER